jgi:3-hydroxyisobutyrate dehydrogenase-like beta-hydroxyacid dehydrogenase
MAAKIARNVITYGGWFVVHEAATLAEAAGVDPATLITVIEAADPNGRTLLSWLHHQVNRDQRIRAMVPQVERLQDKDLAAAQELAAQLGLAVPAVGLTREHGRQTLTIPGEDPR